MARAPSGHGGSRKDGDVDTMMALRAHARGGPEQLVYEQAAVPAPAAGEVLVAVHAAGITFAELTWDDSWITREGRDRTPVIPAHEMSGQITALGADVTGWAAGDEVYGLIDFNRNGAAAEYVTMAAADLAARPASVPHDACATLPLAALTAWQALVDNAATEPGERVLVQGGAGGVGVYAVQLAAFLGAHVTATGRAPHADLVRRLGADDYVTAANGGPGTLPQFDVVIDAVGGTVLQESYGLVREGGRLVTLSAPPSQEEAAARSIHAMFFVVAPDPAELARLAGLTDAGQLNPVISQVLPLAEGRRAYESGTEARPPGKTVLTVR
jgi:NADPH:quinone reductase-like Zn-dependent oxidoreductase